MSHTEYQNWIDYDLTEKIRKNNILKSIEIMYEKYTIKRLREIVKFHNKNVRKEAQIMKKAELKKHIIKVTDYKTKDKLIARLKQSDQFHKPLLAGLQQNTDKKKEEFIKDMAEESQMIYTDYLKKGKNPEFLKQYLNHQAFKIENYADQLEVDRSISKTEFKQIIRKNAKDQLKDAKNNVSIDKLPADQQDFLKDLSKLPKPLQSLKKINKYISKISKAKPEQKKKLIDANIKIVKKMDNKKIKNSKLPEDQKKLLIALSKLDNPLAALKKLVEKVGYKPPVKKVVKAVVKSPEKAPVEEQVYFDERTHNGKTYLVSKDEKEVFDPETDGDTGKTWAEITGASKKAPVRKFTYTGDGFKKYVDGKPGPGSKPTGKKAAGKKTQDLSDVVDILDDISSKQLDQLYERIKSDKKFGTDFKKFNKKLNEVVDDFKKESKNQGVKLTLIGMYYKDTLLNELAGIAEDYIKKFQYKDVHVMPSGKIMEDKKMDSKKEEGKSAAPSKDASKK